MLCLEKLTHFIAEAVEDGHWQSMRAGRNGPFISHLMFADDLLLFCRATSDNMRHVIQVLECLCSLSRQKISAEKTVLFFSKNVPEELRHELVTISSFREVLALGNYLGGSSIRKSPPSQ